MPVLGICYGMQTMAQQLGGKVEAGKVREFGFAEIRARGHTKLFDGIEDSSTPEGHGMLKVWMSHGDKVTAMPPGFKLMASNEACPIAGMADEARGFYAVQFHPEVTHTRQGTKLLHRFVHDICGCGSDWNMPDYVTEAVARIREQVGEEEVILGLSGGRRLFGGCRADPQGNRSATDVRVRRSRAVAPERSHAGHGHVREAPGRESHPRRCQCRIHVASWSAFPIRKPNARVIGKEFVEVFQREVRENQ